MRKSLDDKRAYERRWYFKNKKKRLKAATAYREANAAKLKKYSRERWHGEAEMRRYDRMMTRRMATKSNLNFGYLAMSVISERELRSPFFIFELNGKRYKEFLTFPRPKYKET